MNPVTRAKILGLALMLTVFVVIAVCYICLGQGLCTVDPYSQIFGDEISRDKFSRARGDDRDWYLTLFVEDYYRTKIATIVVGTILSLMVVVLVFLLVLQAKRTTKKRKQTLDVDETKEEPLCMENKKQNS